MDPITRLVLDAAASPTIYLYVFALTVADAFFVVVPSETVVVALGATAMSAGHPELGILIPVAAVAVVLGDTLTYWLGRRLRPQRFRWARRARVARALEWAARSLDRRAAAVLLTARFVPFGRIAVNLTAGATSFAYPRFLLLTSIAGAAWATYNTFVGALFGRILGDTPLLAVVVSVAVAIGVGVVVDSISGRLAGRRAGGR